MYIRDEWLGLLKGKVRQFWQFSSGHTFIFLFPDDNLSKYQSIFTKLVLCLDIVEVWFGIADGRILSIFDRVICLPQNSGRVLPFHIFIVFFQKIMFDILCKLSLKETIYIKYIKIYFLEEIRKHFFKMTSTESFLM